MERPKFTTDAEWLQLYQDTFPELYDYYKDAMRNTFSIITYARFLRPPAPEGLKRTSKDELHIWELLFIDTERLYNSSKKVIETYQALVNRELPYAEYTDALQQLYDLPFLLFVTSRVDRIVRNYLMLIAIGETPNIAPVRGLARMAEGDVRNLQFSLAPPFPLIAASHLSTVRQQFVPLLRTLYFATTEVQVDQVFGALRRVLKLASSTTPLQVIVESDEILFLEGYRRLTPSVAELSNARLLAEIPKRPGSRLVAELVVYVRSEPEPISDADFSALVVDSITHLDTKSLIEAVGDDKRLKDKKVLSNTIYQLLESSRGYRAAERLYLYAKRAGLGLLELRKLLSNGDALQQRFRIPGLGWLHRYYYSQPWLASVPQDELHYLFLPVVLPPGTVDPILAAYSGTADELAWESIGLGLNGLAVSLLKRLGDLTEYRFLSDAVESGNQPLVLAVLKAGDFRDSEEGEDALRKAVEARNTPLVELLLEYGIYSKVAFYEAVLQGYLRGAQKIAEVQQIDFSADDNEALMLAIESGSLPMFRWILRQEEVDPTARNYKAFFDTAQKTDMDSLERFSLLYNDPRTGRLPQEVRKALEQNTGDFLGEILESDPYEAEIEAEYYPDVYEDDVNGEYAEYMRGMEAMARDDYEDYMDRMETLERDRMDSFEGFF